MKQAMLGTLALSFLLLLPPAQAAGDKATAPYPEAVSELVARAKAQVRRIDMKKFRAVWEREKPIALIDVREPDEFAAGHIPGAINIPRGVIEFRIWPYVGYPEKTDMNKRMYLYCGSGSRCSLAAKSLQDLGLGNVIAVDMQFQDWQDAGYPVTEPVLP